MMNKDDEMRAEHDLRGGARGKYYERYREGVNIVVLDADVEPPMPSENDELSS